MSVFCKCKSLSNVNLSNSQFDRVERKKYTKKEIILWYSVLGYKTNNPNFSLETLVLKVNKLNQNSLQWLHYTWV